MGVYSNERRLASWQVGKKELVASYVELTNYNNEPRIDLRVWEPTEQGGKLKPTTKGVTLPKDIVSEFLKVLSNAFDTPGQQATMDSLVGEAAPF